MRQFRWIEWNVGKCEKHGIDPADVEYVVNHAAPPYPQRIGADKRIVWGRTEAGEYLQVIYVYDADDVVFVIHAMPMNERQKRQYRRRKR
jgi:uncharacterized DUF497 family protein